MPAKLVVIGDSLSQGFQSGSICRTELSYPAMIASCLGDTEFVAGGFPDFHGAGGLPLNLEELFRNIAKSCGATISPLEMPAAIWILDKYIDIVENYWERGEGAQPSHTGPIHRNLAVWGYSVGDADTLTSRRCNQIILPAKDNLLLWESLVEYAFFRTARRTLSPRQAPEYDTLSAVDLTERIAEEQNGIDNLIFMLGANNCLGTITDLRIIDSSKEETAMEAHNWQCNLWRKEDFAVLYDRVASRIAALSADEKVKHVFVGTIPYVTIAPVCRGVSRPESVDPQDTEGYYEYYTHFWVWDSDFQQNPDGYPRLSRADAKQIDATIDAYNEIIRTTAEKYRWHVVDINGLLSSLAYRRRFGKICYQFPQGLIDAMLANPATRDRFYPNGQPILDSRYLSFDPAQQDPVQRYRGGIFSLDGIHPTTIGYGVVAHEFLQVMQQADTSVSLRPLDWGRIVMADTLVTDPPVNLTNLQQILAFLSMPVIRDFLKSLGSMIGSSKKGVKA